MVLLYIYTYRHIHTYIYVYIHVILYIHIIYISIHTHTHTHTHMYVCIYMCILFLALYFVHTSACCTLLCLPLMHTHSHTAMHTTHLGSPMAQRRGYLVVSHHVFAATHLYCVCMCVCVCVCVCVRVCMRYLVIWHVLEATHLYYTRNQFVHLSQLSTFLSSFCRYLCLGCRCNVTNFVCGARERERIDYVWFLQAQAMTPRYAHFSQCLRAWICILTNVRSVCAHVCLRESAHIFFGQRANTLTLILSHKLNTY
jgi:hypothetical protein